MIDRVINALECCTQHGSMCGLDCSGHWGWSDDSHTGMDLVDEYRTKCPYGNCETGCVKTLAQDAIAMLRAQEPVEPVLDIDTWKCGNCGHTLEHQELLGDNVLFHEQYNYCPGCGKKVKWE